MDWELVVGRYKPLHSEWINNVYYCMAQGAISKSTGIEHDGKYYF